MNKKRLIEEKLRIYKKPIIEYAFLNELINTYAPEYKIHDFTRFSYITPIIRKKIYINNFSPERSKINELTIGAIYCKNKQYAIGWLYLYNQYHFVDQIANIVSIYSTNTNWWNKEIAGFKFTFLKERPSFFWWIESKQLPDGTEYKCFSKERALIQFIIENNWRLEYKTEIYNSIKNKDIDLLKLQNLSNKYLSKKKQLFINKFINDVSEYLSK